MQELFTKRNILLGTIIILLVAVFSYVWLLYFLTLKIARTSKEPLNEKNVKMLLSHPQKKTDCKM